MKIYPFDLYFDASNKHKDSNITIGEVEDWAKQEDKKADRRRGTLNFYLRPKKVSWFNKLLDYIYA